MTSVSLSLPVVIAVATSMAAQPAGEAPFRPFTDPAYVSVNAVAFGDEGRTMYAGMFVARVEKARGRTVAPDAPEIAIYESRLGADDVWQTPEVVSFSGRWKDYEPTLSPDGQFMVFNSWRPLPSGEVNATGRNNLWLVRRTPAGWGTPISLDAINRAGTEESYATITSDGRIFYVQEMPPDAHGADYNIQVARFEGDRVSTPQPVPVASTSFGEGDPWVAPDGSYLIFTRWDRAAPWQTSVDLYITFARGSAWTPPVPLPEFAVSGAPEYAVTILDGAEPRLYARRAGGLLVRPFAPILAAARKAAGMS